MKLNIIDYICIIGFILVGWYAAALGWLLGALITRHFFQKDEDMINTLQEYEKIKERIIEGNKRRVNYCMFIDDERDPPKNFPRDGVVIRSMESFINYTNDYGLPNFISFDHDLGSGGTGQDIAHYIVARDQEFGDLPEGFTFFVHSQNPIGKENIEGLLNSYLKWRNG